MGTRPPECPSRLAALRTEVAALLQKQAVRRVPDDRSPGFYSHLFLVPKPDGRWRPVIVLNTLNAYLRPPKFRMETARAVRLAVQVNVYAVPLDLQDAYLLVSRHPYTERFLRFALEGTVYEFTALPFGMSIAPWVFTRLMETVVAQVRRVMQSELSSYLDDLLQRNQDPALLTPDLRSLSDILKSLGFSLNVAMSDLIPL
eukprot:TRINITY_DN139_c0_g1_i21.p1 TRINITY_DN139_c0_g1~~TRINITY_DN139_c0_g1_i21.p1  ORF type:complete len:201 (+),score=18.96 TRINITY_DN139_c0_g1_i21:68-670(+)